MANVGPNLMYQRRLYVVYKCLEMDWLINSVVSDSISHFPVMESFKSRVIIAVTTLISIVIIDN